MNEFYLEHVGGDPDFFYVRMKRPDWKGDPLMAQYSSKDQQIEFERIVINLIDVAQIVLLCKKMGD